MKKRSIKDLILGFLEKQYPKDFNLQEIANNIKAHRNSVSTYLKVLIAEGKVKISRIIGNITLYTVAKVEDSKKKRKN